MRITDMTRKQPTVAKKHYNAQAKTYSSYKKKFKYEDFDGLGSTRVVVHEGFRLDIWDYYSSRAVALHKADVKVGAVIAVGVLGLCIVDALLHD